MPSDVAERPSDLGEKSPDFGVTPIGRGRQSRLFHVDRRTRLSRLAAHCLQALYSDVLAGITDLTDTDRMDIEDAALAEARLRMLQEQEMCGKAVASDVAAAFHMSRKARRTVERIAKRLGVKRKRIT